MNTRASGSSNKTPRRTRSQHLRSRHLQLGAEGEARAAALLMSLGYRVVARNARAGGVELDLILRHGPLAVFVEVKTRRTGSRCNPTPAEEAVDARKQARIARGAAAWLRSNGRGVRRARFDVVGCELDGHGRWTLRHWPAAFEAEG